MLQNDIGTGKDKIEFYSSGFNPHGMTYGAWTVRWWKWFFSIERGRNPVFDLTGQYANEKQSEPTWFLAGTWVSEQRRFPLRKCVIPCGVSILFPVLNCEVNPLEYPHLKSKEGLKKHILSDRSTIGKLECFVNEMELPPQLVDSDPEFFPIKLRGDLSENGSSGNTTMTASGYWIFIKTLPEGIHRLSFEGSYQYGKLYSGARYKISVQESATSN